MTSATFAALLLVLGAAALYMASPHQALTAARSGRPAAMGGAIALLVALALLLTAMGPAAAVFTWLTALMLLWSVPPVVIGWLRRRNNGDV